MSWEVQKAVADRRVGSATKKAILMFFAARASDDGSGIWTAKQKMADQLEMNKRTVQRQIGEMIEAGIISETGQRKCERGFTVEYRINLAALDELEFTGVTGPRVAQDHPTGGTQPPLGVAHNHPNNPLEITHEVTNTPKPPRGDGFEILCQVISPEMAEAFIEHRKHKRAKLTDNAARLIANKLLGHHDPNAVIEKSIMNGWTGVFPDSVKPTEGNQNHAHAKSRNDGAAVERARRAGERQQARIAEQQRKHDERKRALDSGKDRNTSQPLLPARQPSRGV